MIFCLEKSLSYLIGSCGRSPEEVIRKGIIEQLFLGIVCKSKGNAAQENREEEDGPDHLFRQACHTCLEILRSSKR